MSFSRRSSQCLEICNQISLLLARETEAKDAVIVGYNGIECGGTAIVEIRCMLPKSAERRGPILFGGGPGGIRGVHAGLGRGMQDPSTDVGELLAGQVTTGAGSRTGQEDRPYRL